MSICKNCNQPFTIYPEDTAFYGKIGVPEPTFCPDCRAQRRLAIRNERVFYHRQCGLCQRSIIAYYPASSPQVVYCPECWYGDGWDPFDYGRDCDFSRPFFSQFQELYQQAPTLSLDLINCHNSEYVSYCGDDKGCYLDIAGEANEDCYYCKFVKYSKDCVDCSFVYHSELGYECVNCHRVFNSSFLNRCLDSDNCHFCYDCRGCHDCFLSWNLRNKKYYFLNKSYSPEEYERKLQDFNLGSYSDVQKLKNEFQKQITKNAIVRFAAINYSQNCIGDDLNNCKDVYHGFDVTKSENSKWLYDVLEAKECYDLNFSLYKPEVSLELISTLNMTRSGFCFACHYSHDLWYSDKCNNSHDLFGCTGLNKQEYCILNKQYPKDKYYDLRQRIIGYMKETGEWGEFFPIGVSGFGYNETVAQEYYPLVQDVCRSHGWPWCEQLPGTRGKETVAVSDMPVDIKEAVDNLAAEIFVCGKCKKNYKIVAQELSFYKKQNICLPRKCPDCRHGDRNIISGERKLYHRQCMNVGCKNKFETTYAPDRPERVYCEECYQREIY